MKEGIISKAAADKAVTSPAAKRPATMQDYINRMSGEIAKALPRTMTPERFTRITLSALSSNKQLQQTTPASFLGAMMQAAALGLEPNTPLQLCYLIPYRNKGELQCQFQIGYKGLIDLAYRSGIISTISAQTVYANDKFDYELGLNPVLRHIPATADRGEPVGFYAVFHTKDGGYGFEYMSVDDARRHAQRFSRSAGSGPWQTNFEEMAKKTVLKKCLKYAPLKSDFLQGVASDETIKTASADNLANIIDEHDETVYETTAVVVDYETGEVKEAANNA